MEWKSFIKRLIIISITVVLMFVLFIFIQQKQNNLKSLEFSYNSMSIEIMSVPKDTIIEDKTISDNIIRVMQLSDWDKWDNNSEFLPNRIIINIDDKYVFWIDEWDEKTEICKLERRYGGKDNLSGIYEIPIGTVEKIEHILKNSNIKWNNLN